MACEMSKTTIGENDYSYTQLSASKSLKLKFSLAAVVGSGFAEMVGHLNDTEDSQMTAFTNAIESIFSKNDPDKIYGLIERIVKPAFMNGERIDIDRDFTGKINELYQVVFWVLKVEYSDFFTEAVQLFPAQKGS